MKTDFNILFNELSDLGIVKTFQSHKTVIQYGQKVNKIYLVKQGGLILNHIHPKTAKKRAINFFIPEFHPLATVSHAYVLNETSKYHLKTFTNTVLVELDRSTIDKFIENSQYAELFQFYGIKTMIEKNELRANLISFTSEEMLQYLHNNFPKILQSVPSKYIADFIGITPQWLSKLKHTF